MRGRLFLAIGFAVLVAAAAGLTGCGEDGGDPEGRAALLCSVVKRCDVRERGCQRSVMEAMACLRGGSSDDLPAVRVISEDEFIERVTSYGADDPELQAEREDEFALWNRGLSLFGLAPTGYELDEAALETVSQVAAAYFPEEREIAIIDRGEPLGDARAVELFAHEIVHALQDQELDLRAYQERWSTSFDASLALAALIEGEAVHYQIIAAAQLAGRSADALDWPRLYSGWRTETQREAEADDAPVALADVRFPYAFGGDFVTSHWRKRDRAGIDALFEDPPRTTSQVLFDRSASELAAEQEALSARAVPALDEPFVEASSTALGAWIALMYAERAVPRVPWSSDIARALGADVFSVQYDAASDTLVAAWRARMFAGTSSAVVWPSPARAVIHETDESGRETYSVTADPQLPAQPEMLAWREAAEPEQGEQDAAAASPAWRLGVGRGHHRTCAANRPRLVFTDP
jgi:hypothetical protein